MEITDLSRVYRLLHPKLTVLVVSRADKGDVDVMAAAWAMPASTKPPVVAVAIAPKRKTYENIMATKEFVISVPTMDMLDKVIAAGSVSGHKQRNKFEGLGFKGEDGAHTSLPRIKGAAANLECRLLKHVEVGDHVVFFGEVLGGNIGDEFYEKGMMLRIGRLIYHYGGSRFGTLEKETKEL